MRRVYRAFGKQPLVAIPLCHSTGGSYTAVPTIAFLNISHVEGAYMLPVRHAVTQHLTEPKVGFWCMTYE
jgi:hypothetical protein